MILTEKNRTPEISVVIPFLNERDNLALLIQCFKGLAKNGLSGVPFELVLVDDGSTDGSSEFLAQLTYSEFHLQLVRLSKNFGSHAALRAGLTVAQGKKIVMMTADLQDPPEIVASLYLKSLEGADIVWAQREGRVVKYSEYLFSRWYAWLMRNYAVAGFPREGFDVVLISEQVQREINECPEKNSSIFVQILDLGFKQVSISYRRNQRQHGRSKWTFWKKIKLALDSFISFSYVPIRFVSFLGFFLSLSGFGWFLFLLARKIFVGDLIQGWAGLMAILLVGFGLTNVALGVIAEYLWRTLDASRGRKVFVIDKILRFER